MIDASATSLATGPTLFGSNTSAIAYDEVGNGLTAYVGGLSEREVWRTVCETLGPFRPEPQGGQDAAS